MRNWLRVIGLLLLGLAVGVGLGLYLGWAAWPTEFTDANPSVLQDRYRRDYINMIATVYAEDDDLAQARKRIAYLGENGADDLFSFTLDTILQAKDDVQIQQLVRLAVDLGLYSPAMEPYLSSTTEPSNGE